MADSAAIRGALPSRGRGTGPKLWREAAIQNSPGALALGEATIKCALKVATEGVAERVIGQ